MIRKLLLVCVFALSVMIGTTLNDKPIIPENTVKEFPTQTIDFEPMLMPLECLEDESDPEAP